MPREKRPREEPRSTVIPHFSAVLGLAEMHYSQERAEAALAAADPPGDLNAALDVLLGKAKAKKGEAEPSPTAPAPKAKAKAKGKAKAPEPEPPARRRRTASAPVGAAPCPLKMPIGPPPTPLPSEPAAAPEVIDLEPSEAGSSSDVCAVCLGEPEPPFELRCSHVLCVGCLRQTYQTGAKSCPLCRQPFATAHGGPSVARPEGLDTAFDDSEDEPDFPPPWLVSPFYFLMKGKGKGKGGPFGTGPSLADLKGKGKGNGGEVLPPPPPAWLFEAGKGKGQKGGSVGFHLGKGYALKGMAFKGVGKGKGAVPILVQGKGAVLPPHLPGAVLGEL